MVELPLLPDAAFVIAVLIYTCYQVWRLRRMSDKEWENRD